MTPGEVDVKVKTAFLRCKERSGLKLDVLAALMGISKQQLSQQLLPGGHVSISRLMSMADDDDGRRFLQMFWSEMAEHVGMEDMDAVASELRRFHGRIGSVIDKLQVRMAKAELRAVEKERNVA